MKHLALVLTLSLPFLAHSAAPIVIAHRGASGYLPEHTLEAKAMAHAMGADFIEQDIVLSKDDAPVVLHDIYLDTVSDVATRFPDRQRADGRFYALDLTLAELKQLRVTERFDPKTGRQVYPKRFPKDQSSFQIPTLEEELQLIQGLNLSTGRNTGIYPEIKQPAWHRKQGHDISRIVLPILQRYGYATKTDSCWLQCFELPEVKRLRTELGWQGRLVLLLGGGRKGDDGADADDVRSPEGLAELSAIADGIGPALSSVISGKSPADRSVTNLVKEAHAHNLAVHPYTLRFDELPKTVNSADELMNLLFEEAKVDGLFTDFPDLVVRWLAQRK
ncbi:MAG: glycerophosphoryl diester phosphodiesterase [Chthoniobacter sp.]|jgi:glycerophosphoryl diester phosphodiesterase|nr:glycerophosphoryl diester phosphodiesterase [Chthoniobacter sp.]